MIIYIFLFTLIILDFLTSQPRSTAQETKACHWLNSWKPTKGKIPIVRMQSLLWTFAGGTKDLGGMKISVLLKNNNFVSKMCFCFLRWKSKALVLEFKLFFFFINKLVRFYNSLHILIFSCILKYNLYFSKAFTKLLRFWINKTKTNIFKKYIYFDTVI